MNIATHQLGAGVVANTPDLGRKLTECEKKVADMVARKDRLGPAGQRMLAQDAYCENFHLQEDMSSCDGGQSLQKAALADIWQVQGALRRSIN